MFSYLDLHGLSLSLVAHSKEKLVCPFSCGSDTLARAFARPSSTRALVRSVVCSFVFPVYPSVPFIRFSVSKLANLYVSLSICSLFHSFVHLFFFLHFLSLVCSFIRSLVYFCIILFFRFYPCLFVCLFVFVISL